MLFRSGDSIGRVRAMMEGRRYDCASHVVVCEDSRFLGILRIEHLMAAAADARVDSLMDREAPVVAPRLPEPTAI